FLIAPHRCEAPGYPPMRRLYCKQVANSPLASLNPLMTTPTVPWWRDVTRAQWLVLAIASAGWVFDVFEGQLYGAYKSKMMPALVSKADEERVFSIGLAAFLLGGALGGLGF